MVWYQYTYIESKVQLPLHLVHSYRNRSDYMLPPNNILNCPATSHNHSTTPENNPTTKTGSK